MKILFINHKISVSGGIENYIWETTKRLLRDGHQVDFLAIHYEAHMDGVNSFSVPLPIGPKWLKRLVFAFKATHSLEKITGGKKFDVVIANNSSSFKCDVVVAHSVHKAAIVKTNRIFRDELPYYKYLLIKVFRFFRPQNIVTKFIERYAYKFGSRAIVAVSAGVKDELVSFYGIPPGKISVIENGVDVERFRRNNDKRQSLRKKYGIRENDIALIFVAHEFRRKGLQFIIDALSFLGDDKVKLFVVGGDDFAPYAEQAKRRGVLESVIFAGKVKSGIEAFYSAADIFVFPTGYEAFSLATLEAASSGLPLLITRVNGSTELVSEGANGYFIERSGRFIAEKIHKIIRGGTLEEFGRNSRSIAESRFSWDKKVVETEKLLEKITHGLGYHPNL